MSNHRMPLLRSLALLAVIVAAFAARPARADDTVKTVEGVGEAAVINGDEATAKDKAKQAALRDAVERTLGTFVVSDSQTKDFALVKDQILSTSQGYVKSYDVLETKKDGEAYTVRVKAVVSNGKINEDLVAKGLTIRMMKFPRMALLIAEQNIGQTSPTVWWGPQGGGQQAGGVMTVDERTVENKLIDEWTQVGFSFVDMDALAGKLKAANVVSTNPSANEIRQIANLSDADVIIVGTAVASLQGDLSKLLGGDKSGDVAMKSCKGAISARVFNADSGEILATSEKSHVSTHIDQLSCGRIALQEATHVFADDLQGKLLAAWNKRLMGGSRVRMSVKNVDFSTLKALKEYLTSSVRGVQGVEQKGFKDNSADLDVRLDGGDTEALGNDLDGHTFGKLKVKVTGATANTIQIELAR
jgi:hypothetical protein